MDETSLNDSNVKVAVRVRPMNRREKDLKTKCVIEMEGNQTILHPACGNMGKGDTRSQPKVFAYDYCFWSMDEADAAFAGQDVVFQCLGESLLDNAFQGYNACIFAYGQTGSGKSYTMMGSADQPGLTPRLCSALFERSTREQREGESFTVEVSFMEIYNEKVRDLLDPKGSRQALRVREHNVLGPYVDGLSRLAVANYKDIESLMSEGNKSRTVAATNMNEESSRSHGVFNIILTHTLKDMQSGTSGEKVSKLSLVDLAGSERAAKTGAAGERLKEGSNINKSLTTLGLVISALADQGAGKNKSKFVPYRDSVLTWLLKDSLGGNSRTAMVATVSPAADNYEETLSTLRYADRAKSIVNHAVVNEDPNARIIRELREEVEKLRDQLTEAESMKAPELKDRLEESEKLIQEMTVTWADKLRKTEAIAQERQKQLESLGISLQSSGIRVMEDKCFLVNLNADPALNELLVYYLKDHTRVGSADSQDIQLCGMAIQAEHCVINITSDSGVVLTPHKTARTCVNGTPITTPIQLHHGDRILWGNNHFFRINMPKLLSRSTEEEEGGTMNAGLSTEQLEVDVDTVSQGSSDTSFNYEYAQTEVMMKALGNNDPMQAVLQTLERRHEEEKRSALERQRQMYEQELQQLRRRLTPEKQQTQQTQQTQPPHHRSTERLSLGGPSASVSVLSSGAQSRLRQWSEEREAVMTRSLRKLREQIVRANLLVQEASFIAEELNKRTEYRVTLQIPAANLNANKKRDVVLSEPAVQVRRKGKGKQIWAMEKMENRLVDMRELYQEWKDYDEDDPVMRSYFKRADPFFDEQENHSLIGVANVFLSCLFFDVKLQYAVPIINQKGEVAGRLHVEVERVSGDLDESEMGSEEPDRRTAGEGQERQLVCTIRVVQATGLPQHLSNFVFCQYHFWEQEDPVFIPPEVDPSTPHTPSSKEPQCLVVFDSSKELEVAVTEDFVEFLSEGAVAIEVYGHKLAHPRRNLALWDLGVIQAKTRSLRERWSEVVRRLELWVQVLELNEGGEFTPVEVVPAKDVRTGGIFQLRQGQSRRIQVEVRSVQDSGTLPLIAENILSVAVGNVVVRQTRPSKGGESQQGGEEMDSYQEGDLERLRAHWLAALTQRQEYLDQHLQKLVGKADKSEDDVEREAQLLECRLTLTEERNAVLVPSAGSGIPGAPAEWSPPPGMETHIPVLFLDLSADDFYDHLTPSLAGGLDASLSEEDEDEFFDLQIVKHHDVEVKAEASWDPTVHDCRELSRGGGQGQRVYLTVRAAVLLSHPAEMQLVLRKRICVSLTGRQGFAQSFLKKMSQRSTIPGSGITFEIVSNVPGDSQGPEDREMLVRMAASADNPESSDSEAAIEKYLRSVLAVENILTLDRLRQEVAVKEHLAAKGKIRRRCLSSPSVHRLSGSRQDLSSFHHEPHIIKNPLEDMSALPPAPLRSPSSPNTSLQSSSGPDSVKALVPPVPKMLKSLFPRRDEKKDLRPASLSQQVESARPGLRDPEGAGVVVFDLFTGGHNVPRIIVQSASLEEDLGTAKLVPQTPGEEEIPEDYSEPPHEAPSVPVCSFPQMDDVAVSSLDRESGISEAAVTDISMTTVMAEASAAEDQSESLEALPLPYTGLELEDPALSDVSDVSSGYMSTTISMGTLSEAPISNSDQTTSATPDFQSESFTAPTNQDGLEVSIALSPPIKTDDDDDADRDEAEEPQVCHVDKDEEPESLPASEDQTKTSQTPPTQQEPTDVLPVPSSPPSEADTDVTSYLVSQEESHTTNLDPSPLEDSPSSLAPGPAETQPSPSSSSASPPDPPHSGTPPPDPPSAPDSSSEVTQESCPSPPESLPEPQPPFHSIDAPPATDSQSPLSVEAGISSTPSQAASSFSSLTPQLEAPVEPAPTTKQPPPKAMPVGNPFKIQKIKTSDIKSFKGIADNPGEPGGSGSLLGLLDPLERLEIISDSEECIEGQEGPERPLPGWLKDGEYVTVGTNKHGTVRYVGPTEFAEGTWVGVELDVPAGKNDGSVNGQHYFHCNPGYGVLVRPDRVTRAEGTAKRKRKKRHSTNLSVSTTNLSGSSTNLSRSTTNLSGSSTNLSGSSTRLSGSSTRLSGSSTNLAALTALAKREGAGSARRGENRKSWNS
ncbi:kinesin-like protein KIF13B isoform X3 [Clupea harengus]|uniref:Kinesin-like protein KIF13B isoform X3 n=1 Tax=Clupea harengus TaxID=7950 RepID=A0A6P8GIP3_CLUHA|nr:kinesin-like protein KIF13B isoform X3 [Clupea harengus]